MNTEGFIKKHISSKPKWHSLFTLKHCSLHCPMVVRSLDCDLGRMGVSDSIQSKPQGYLTSGFALVSAVGLQWT